MGARDPEEPKEHERSLRRKPRRDASCQVKVGKELRRGTASLDDDRLVFHTGRSGAGGKDFSLRIEFEDIRSMDLDAHKGLLTIVTDEQKVTFHLGRLAADWKDLIETRPSAADLFGLKPKSRIAVVAVDDDELAQILPPAVEEGEVDHAFVGVSHKNDLPRIAELAKRVRPGGAVWAVLPAGTRLDKREIFAAARAAGLVEGSVIGLDTGAEALALRKT